MHAFFVFIGLWLIGWGILLVSLLLRGSPSAASSDPNPSPRGHHGHPLTLFDTTEIAL